MPLTATTGASRHVDAFTAGQEAARPLREARPAAVLCFASVHYDQAEVLRGIREVLGDVPLLGASTGAAMTEAGWFPRGVALAALRGDAVQVAVGVGPAAARDAAAAGRAAADQVSAALGRAPRILLAFPPAVFTADTRAFIEGLGASCPEAIVLGGASAPDGQLAQSDPLFLKNFQYQGTEVSEDTAVVLGLAWDEDAAVTDAWAWGHGFAAVGVGGTVSGAEGALLRSIDGQPAASFFQRYLGDRFDFRVDAATVTLGMGITGPTDAPFRVNPALGIAPDGAIQYILPLSPGDDVQVVRTTRTEMLRAARQTAETLRTRLGERVPATIFVFSCGGRHGLLGDRCAEELAAVQAVFGAEVPVIGFQCGGELAPLGAGDRGVPHNYTIALYAQAGT